jgi:mono/diheme cytochrome c family protein
MRKAGLIVALIGFSASGVLAAPPDGANAKAGKAIFEKHCAVCHGPNGEGKEAIAKMYKVTMPPLGSKLVQAKSDADIKKVVTDGYGKMKPVKGLSATELADLVAYIRTLKK